MPKQTQATDPKEKPIAVIRTSQFPRELLEQAYREIEQNKARKQQGNAS
jgi:hypothetical protein